MRPMLATRGERVPVGPDWCHEVKWDGIRALVEVGASGARLWSRNENDVSAAYPELRSLRSDRGGLLLDSEIVALRDGVPSFGALADRMHVRDPARAERLAASDPVTLVVFDLLRRGGVDLMDRPLHERRARLADLTLDGPSCLVPPTYDDGPSLLAAAEQQRLEGIVSKRLESRYQPGRRSRDWLKFPLRPTGSFVVGGYRFETDSDQRLGALLVGAPERGGLRYRGKVGSGVAGRAGRVLGEQLRPLAVTDSPFLDELPRVDRAGTVWVEPRLVVDVQFLAVTADGRLRQPAYRGIRTDLTTQDLHSPGDP
ncbi:non-homologous end-joining DNA ligase [Nocardioides terrisoli]|uniref:non-homologous end-joining DNA ligase n=1 Tax=Nocardioides terrisoli TaxID=3388267 RepID=UPI00287B6CB8|nr:non-homologous end-joining DNA ligase [Nocardioides marmorisolisilvae]